MLSGGEQQMLTLCRTLMGDPDLIMIDEPTEGLAPKIVELVAEYLQRAEEPRHLGAAGRAEADDRPARSPSAATSWATARSSSKARPATLRGNAAIRKEWLEV